LWLFFSFELHFSTTWKFDLDLYSPIMGVSFQDSNLKLSICFFPYDILFFWLHLFWNHIMFWQI
jgi:hypothetical protein